MELSRRPSKQASKQRKQTNKKAYHCFSDFFQKILEHWIHSKQRNCWVLEGRFEEIFGLVAHFVFPKIPVSNNTSRNDRDLVAVTLSAVVLSSVITYPRLTKNSHSNQSLAIEAFEVLRTQALLWANVHQDLCRNLRLITKIY
jgi:hypothetical protein